MRLRPAADARVLATPALSFVADYSATAQSVGSVREPGPPTSDPHRPRSRRSA